MSETLRASEAIGLTLKSVREYTPSLPPGEPVDQEIAENYIHMYQRIVNVGEMLAGERMYSRIWFLDGRPVLVASNHPIPESPTHLEDWKVDLGILCHADTVKLENPEETKEAHFDGEYIYGPGAGDMKWQAAAGVAAVAKAPKEVCVAMAVYTNEEIGGADMEHLVQAGFNPRVVLMADGAPLQEGQGIMSIVNESKAGVRMRLETTSTRTHAAHLRLAELPLVPFRIAHLLIELEKTAGKSITNPDKLPWEDATFNPTFPEPIGSFPGSTAEKGVVVFDIRAQQGDKLKEATQLICELAGKYNFSAEIITRIAALVQEENDTVKKYREIAEEIIGKNYVVNNRDYGGNDLVKFSEETTRILLGIRGDRWHGGRDERVSAKAVYDFIMTFERFSQMIPQLLEKKSAA